MIDRKYVVDQFGKYTEKYDISMLKIQLKVAHTYRVAALCDRIADSLMLEGGRKDLAWLIGMLHDIARFEQVRIYDSYNDAETVDHAQFGGDLLFNERLIDEFVREGELSAEEYKIVEIAIRNHNKYRIDSNLSDEELMYAKLIRDADKVDIIKANTDFPLWEIYNVSEEEMRQSSVTKEVLDAFNEEHAILRKLKKTAADNIVGHVSLVYELEYKESIRALKELGYLEKFLEFESDNPETREIIEYLRTRIFEYMEGRLMEKVYFTDFKTTMNGETILQKFKRLLKAGGIEEIDFADKFTAIKIHFGEYGNLAFLRSNYAKVLADYIKELGGKPFLTDCNTLYVGSRKNALDHLDNAYLNGYSPLQTGCHVIIADGLKGTDETLVPVNLEYVKEAKIGHAIMDADVFVSLSHFKGHEGTGFGGAIKNIGMGCGSRAGKMEQHCEGKPSVARVEDCVGCGACQRICAHGAPEITNKKATINHDKCVGCGRCLSVCPKNAIDGVYDSNERLSLKMAEYAYAVVHNRPQFHISIICDVSPNCDCHAENDVPIIPNVGMLASFDPVALDQACVDLCNKMPVNEGSALDENIKEMGHVHKDHFDMNHPDTKWEVCLEHCVEIGLGTREYELIKI